nr:hypothetical protein [Mycobacterium uberis]
MPIRRLWSVGPVAEEKLHRLGIETIRQLTALADAEAANSLGATIRLVLHPIARGIDGRPITERVEARQINSGSTFTVDLTGLEQLCEVVEPCISAAYWATAVARVSSW